MESHLKPRHAQFRVEDFEELKASASAWRVKGMWPDVGLCFVGGPSQAGKSFWLLNAAAALAQGAPVAGANSRRCGVLYVAAEGAGGVKKRVEGLRQHTGPLGRLCKFLGQSVDLTSFEDVEALRATVEAVQTEFRKAGEELGVVVIDTLSAATPGVEENTSGDLGKVLNTLQRLAADHGLLVLVAAHTGKDPSRGLRGWSGQFANADGVIMLDPPSAGVFGGELVKVKDSASGRRFCFRLRPVVLGIDDEGEEITTCVVEECEASGRKIARMLAPGQAHDADLIVRVLRELESKGQANVTKEALRNAAYSEGLGGADPGAEREHRIKWMNRRNKAFSRALTALEQAARIRIDLVLNQPVVRSQDLTDAI
jgi:hypothetical protein